MVSHVFVSLVDDSHNNSNISEHGCLVLYFLCLAPAFFFAEALIVSGKIVFNYQESSWSFKEDRASPAATIQQFGSQVGSGRSAERKPERTLLN
jgi:hypothetical protein